MLWDKGAHVYRSHSLRDNWWSNVLSARDDTQRDIFDRTRPSETPSDIARNIRARTDWDNQNSDHGVAVDVA